jgi:hypothetical protein
MLVMKKAALFVSVIFFLASCVKEKIQRNGPVVDPRFSRVISRDTLVTGNFWGLVIGQKSDQTYTILQNIKSQRHIQYLGIVNNVFTKVTDLQTRIGLYRELLLDETSGTPEGIQLSFLDNKVKSIYTNNGKNLSTWPALATNTAVIKTDDPLTTVYNKLVSISNAAAYASKFQRISLISKNIDTDYDPHMALSNNWQFTTSVDNNNQWLMVDLNFSNGTLVSIYVTLSEY